MKLLIEVMLASAALAVVGCGDANSDSEQWSAGSGSADEATNGAAKLAGSTVRVGAGVTIKSRESQYGKVLFSKGNRAIYYFEKESTRKPKCYGSCAQAWPPVVTKGRPQASGSVRSGLLGTTDRNGGKKQATYKGHPLYFYVNDPRGEVGCHNVEEFGGLWLAVKPNGNAVSESRA
jgi:predicted lipoprotein with Yx(FWY)xxD motif